MANKKQKHLTKKDIVKFLEELPDDTKIFIYNGDYDYPWVPAENIQLNDKADEKLATQLGAYPTIYTESVARFFPNQQWVQID